MRLHSRLSLGALALYTALCADTSTSDRKTVWSGVYTSKQAARGAVAYMAACSRCHREDLSAYSGLRGAKFIDNWREDNLSSLWTRISKTMPADDPGVLAEREYLDILAYILQANDFPAGEQDLDAGVLSNIRLERKRGAAPVPNFALVQAVGCLGRDTENIWRVTRASEPARTHNPYESSAAELQSAAAELPGKSIFQILDGSSLKVDSHDGRKVKVKGFLIRRPDEDRLNATSIEVVGLCR